MDYQQKLSSTAATKSLVDWWKMAGVNYLVADAPVNWLVTDETETFQQVVNNPIMPISGILSPADWPKNVTALQSAIADGQPLPGNRYGGKSAAPVGNINGALMIISDLPDIEEIEAGQLGVGAAGRLLSNMIAAMGHNLTDCSLIALATTRPATGELPDEDLPLLATFALHQINLVNPDAVLILGSATCRALLGAELMGARGNLHYINQDVVKKAAVPTFHPRTLLARPNLKAQAWKDLQMLAKKDAL
jgi:uracil-DNA glycosylase